MVNSYSNLFHLDGKWRLFEPLFLFFIDKAYEEDYNYKLFENNFMLKL